MHTKYETSGNVDIFSHDSSSNVHHSTFRELLERKYRGLQYQIEVHYTTTQRAWWWIFQQWRTEKELKKNPIRTLRFAQQKTKSFCWNTHNWKENKTKLINGKPPLFHCSEIYREQRQLAFVYTSMFCYQNSSPSFLMSMKEGRSEWYIALARYIFVCYPHFPAWFSPVVNFEFIGLWKRSTLALISSWSIQQILLDIK